MARQVVAPGAKQGQAVCPAQVCPLSPAGSSHSSDTHQYRHCHWVPGPVPSSSHTHSFNPHNNLTGGYCYHLYIRCGKWRHREVDCLWKPDLNLGSLALSLHSAAFPKRTIVISLVLSPGCLSGPPSRGAVERTTPRPRVENAMTRFLPRLPKTRGQQASARTPCLPASPSSLGKFHSTDWPPLPTQLCTSGCSLSERPSSL